MTNTQLGIFTQKSEFDYQIIPQENNFQAISIPIEEEVDNIYFLLEPTNEDAYTSFAAQIVPHE